MDVVKRNGVSSDKWVQLLPHEYLQNHSYTYGGAIPTDQTLNTWAYVQVFGILQWTIFFTVLVVLATALTMAEACIKRSENDSHLTHFLSNIAKSFLFCLPAVISAVMSPV